MRRRPGADRRGAGRAAAAVLAATLVVGPTAGCAAGGADDNTVTVLAAASLTDTFTELAAAFEAAHPGVDVRLSFGSSTTLAQQAADGAPGDVLATADERAMQVAVDAGVVVAGPQALATNSLVLVTPPDDPAGVDDVRDLARDDVTWVGCVRSAPCGALAHEVLEGLDVPWRPASEEVDVRAVLARVVSGEADAGLVYRTDARSAGDAVATVPLPANGATNGATNRYSVATLTEGGAAADFVELVTGPRGRDVLAEAGFEVAGGSADDAEG